MAEWLLKVQFRDNECHLTFLAYPSIWIKISSSGAIIIKLFFFLSQDLITIVNIEAPKSFYLYGFFISIFNVLEIKAETF